MNCRAATELLPLHVGHDLSIGEARDLEMHLNGCTGCTTEMERFRESRNALLSARDDSVEASGIWQALAPRLEAIDAARQIQRPWYRRPAGIARVAAALLVLAAVPFVLPMGEGALDAPGGEPAGPELYDLALEDAGAPVLAESESGELVPASNEELLRFLNRTHGWRSGAVPAPDENLDQVLTPVGTPTPRRF